MPMGLFDREPFLKRLAPQSVQTGNFLQGLVDTGLGDVRLANEGSTFLNGLATPLGRSTLPPPKRRDPPVEPVARKKSSSSTYECLRNDASARCVFFVAKTLSFGDGWGQDALGNLIHVDAYGEYSDYGWHIDHIKAQARGGSDDWFNLRPLHWYANCARGAG